MLNEADKTRYLAQPRIPNAEVNLLWDVEYYDLPLTGVAEWRGEKYWFDSIEDEIPEQKEFFLFRLPPAEMKKVEDLQRLREEMFDAANRHDAHFSPDHKLIHLLEAGREQEYQQGVQAYWEASRRLPQPDFSTAEAIGWCYWKEPENKQTPQQR